MSDIIHNNLTNLSGWQLATDILDMIIQIALKKDSSDVNFGANERVALRVNGEIAYLDEFNFLSKQQAEDVIFFMIGDQIKREKLIQDRELDFAYTHSDGNTFRCNAFYRSGNVSVSMRYLSKIKISLDVINAPQGLRNLLTLKQGLILVCGPTGHGKTTTAYAMLEEINKIRKNHIVTIEDPIEYVIKSENCIVSQRQINRDTQSFSSALRSAMRQDPDIILLGEMRDRETVEAVFNLCATGHLVISTIHSNSASQTIHRILQFFPQAQHEIILGQLSSCIAGILNQRLVPANNGSRTAIFELMLGNHAIKSAIKRGDIFQIENSIATSSSSGMLSMKQSMQDLIDQGMISFESSLPFVV